MQRVGCKARHRPEVERVIELRRRENQLRGQVLFVVLHHERQRAYVDAVLQQIALQILQALEILVELAGLAVAHKHDAIGALQHEPSRRVVIDLPRHRVELESRREAGDLPQVDGEKIEEQRAVGLGGQRYHASAPGLGNATVDVVQIRRLSGPARSVVDDFARDLAAREVDQGHGLSPKQRVEAVRQLALEVRGQYLLRYRAFRARRLQVRRKLLIE